MLPRRRRATLEGDASGGSTSSPETGQLFFRKAPVVHLNGRLEAFSANFERRTKNNFSELPRAKWKMSLNMSPCWVLQSNISHLHLDDELPSSIIMKRPFK